MDITYKEFIDNILKTRGRFACGNEYHERHHIVPKCIGGGNDEDNLIDLFGREHFEAHRLLALENPENDKLIYAWWNMSHMNKVNQRDYEITAEEYEEAKKEFRKLAIEKGKRYIGENNPNYGKHCTDETREKIRKAIKGKFIGENNPMYGKHHTEEVKRKISKASKNRPCETRKKMSESAKLRCTYNYKQDWLIRRNKWVGEKHPRAKQVCQYDISGNFIKIFNYIQEAANNIGVDQSCISTCCNGKQKTAGSFIWYYLYDQTRKDGTVIQGAIALGLITEEEAIKILEEQKEIQGED